MHQAGANSLIAQRVDGVDRLVTGVHAVRAYLLKYLLKPWQAIRHVDQHQSGAGRSPALPGESILVWMATGWLEYI